MFGFWFLLVLLILIFVAMPWWPYSRGWGYFPGGILIALLLLWLLLIWLGYIAWAWPWAAY